MRDTTSTTSTTSVRLAVAYWEDDGTYPRAGRGRRRREGYWRNLATMAATWQRVAAVPTTVVAYTNGEPPAEVTAVLDRLAVERRHVPFGAQPPEGFTDRFPSALYSLDVVAAAAADLGDEELLVLVDPDVVWANDPTPLLTRARRDGAVAYAIPYGPDRRELGVTRRDLGALFQELDPAAPVLPSYFGGELLVADRETLAPLRDAAQVALEASFAWARAGRRPYLLTEEHVLSYALWKVGRADDNAGDLIRRLWTVPPVRNVRGDEDQLLAWHVLQEKATGLWRLFDDLVAERGAFAATTPEGYRARLARRLGLTLTPPRRMRYLVRRTARRVAGRAPLPPNEG